MITPRVRDPIRGMIHYTELEEVVMDTPVVQRLRGIKQLALTEYVYPGTKHSRFEHSIGTMHVAGELARKVGLDGESLADVRLAGLLHDLGHGPFSHVLEHCLKECSPLSEDRATDKIHEQITVELIRSDDDLRSVVGTERLDRVAKIIDHNSPRSLLTDIVSGPVDADKLDYLLRDSHYAGVKYGSTILRELSMRQLQLVMEKALALSMGLYGLLNSFFWGGITCSRKCIITELGFEPTQ